MLNRDIFDRFLVAFFFLAILLNGSTLVAILASRTLRRTPHIFTFSIALADFSAACVAGLMQTPLGRGVVTARILTGIFGASMMTSICSTLAVAFHRLVIIRLSPFNCKQVVTAPRCIAVGIAIWTTVFSIFLGVHLNDESYRFFNFIQPILNFSAITVCGVCYLVIYNTLGASARRVHLSSDAQLQRVAQNKRVLLTFALIVGSNMACWSVFIGFLMLSYIAVDKVFLKFDPLTYAPWTYPFIYSAWLLVNINAVLNPIIYWTRLSDFRELLLSCCCCCCRRCSISSSSPPSSNTKPAGGRSDAGKLAIIDQPPIQNENPGDGIQNEGYKVEV